MFKDKKEENLPDFFKNQVGGVDYKYLLDNLDELVLILGRTGKILYANKKVSDISGYAKEELVGTSMVNYLTKDSIKTATLALAREFFGKTHEGLEVKIETKASGIRTLFIAGNSTKIYDHKKLVGLLINAHDITEIKESEKKYRLIVNNSSDFISILSFSATPKYLYVSPSHERLLGYAPEDLLGKNGLDFVHPSDKIKMIGILKEYLKEFPLRMLGKSRKKWHENFDFRFKTKSGEWRDLRASADLVDNKILLITHDVTEENKVGARYRLIMENTSDLIALATFDQKAKYVYVNSSYERILGFKADELIGQSVFDFMHPDDLKNVLPLLKKYLGLKIKGLLSGKEINVSEKLEARFRDNTGKWHNLHTTANLAGDKLLFISKDITEGKKMEDKLKKESEKFKKYFDITNVIIVAFGVDGKVSMINKKGCEVLGRAREEIVGKDWVDNFIEPDKKAEIKIVFKSLISNKEKPIEDYENYILTKGGQKRLIAWKNARLKNDEGQIVGVLSSGEDITEKRKMETELKKSAKQWEETLNFLSGGVSVHANDFSIIDVNQSLRRLLGKNKEEIIGRKCYEIFHNQSRPIKGCPLLKSAKTKKKESLEYFEPVLKKWLIVATVPIMDEKGKIKKTIHEVRDITERKQVEIEIKKRNKELERANKLMIGRELKMVELKKKIRQMEERLED